jgi:hypothetical protein
MPQQSELLKKWMSSVKTAKPLFKDIHLPPVTFERPHREGFIEAARYRFIVDSIEIPVTRARHNDTNHITMSAAVAANRPVTAYRELGDMNHTPPGGAPINMSLEIDVGIDGNAGVVFNYLIVNRGHGDADPNLQQELEKFGSQLASEGAKEATAAIGAAIGLSVGSGILPIIGSILGALAGWLISTLGGLFFADCDGPVAAEQLAFKAKDLLQQTEANGGSIGARTHHPGLSSPDGCNTSDYYVTWTITKF